jgi:NADPH-dependent 7-cyano-7-deazaguanine reductase QueF
MEEERIRKEALKIGQKEGARRSLIEIFQKQITSGCPRTRQQDAGEETSPLP